MGRRKGSLNKNKMISQNEINKEYKKKRTQDNIIMRNKILRLLQKRGISYQTISPFKGATGWYVTVNNKDYIVIGQCGINGKYKNLKFIPRKEFTHKKKTTYIDALSSPKTQKEKPERYAGRPDDWLIKKYNFYHGLFLREGLTPKQEAKLVAIDIELQKRDIDIAAIKFPKSKKKHKPKIEKKLNPDWKPLMEFDLGDILRTRKNHFVIVIGKDKKWTYIQEITHILKVMHTKHKKIEFSELLEVFKERKKIS